MERSPSRFFLPAMAMFLAGCGAVASLPPSDEAGGLSGRLSEAVWYAEKGDQTDLAVAVDNAILVLPPGDDSTYVNGAFSLDIPDRDRVELEAGAAMQTGGAGALLFQAYVQAGTDFPKLAEMVVDAASPPVEFRVDLTPFRGRSLLLILAVSTPDGTPLTTPALWIDPRIVTP